MACIRRHSSLGILLAALALSLVSPAAFAGQFGFRPAASAGQFGFRPAVRQPGWIGHPQQPANPQRDFSRPANPQRDFNRNDFQRNDPPRNDPARQDRMSPDERRQLRRDIRDAGREIYPPRRS